MSNEKFVNITRLITTYKLEIEQLPDNLKCTQCKLVLKDACQLSCCCRYCRACIDDMMAIGNEFCPGDSVECGESLLSRYQSNYLANKGVSRLDVKCPHDGCMYKSQLANIEEHLRECSSKSEKCPFRELGCTQDKLAVEEMGRHLQLENRTHTEIIISMIVNIKKEIETLKQRDERSSREMETLKQKQEASSREIEMLNHVLVLKDEKIRSIMDQMIHVQNENKSFKNDIKLIKEENEDLAGRLKILAEQIEREIADKCENDELHSARVVEHVDREIATVTLLIGSNKDKLVSEMQSVRSHIVLINQDAKSMKDDICAVKSQVQSVQALMGLGQFDASFVQLFDINLDKTDWRGGDRLSGYFTGQLHPYKYRLELWNYYIGTARAELRIILHICAGPKDLQLMWPFNARVVITVTDRDRHEACRSTSQQCRIDRPPDNSYSWSDAFMFFHSELKADGLNLSRGVRVSCVIVPGTG